MQLSSGRNVSRKFEHEFLGPLNPLIDRMSAQFGTFISCSLYNEVLEARRADVHASCVQFVDVPGVQVEDGISLTVRPSPFHAHGVHPEHPVSRRTPPKLMPFWTALSNSSYNPNSIKS